MAHELDIRNGQASMAYVGATPWHGLGQVLTPGASIETWVKEAGMAYTLEEAKVQFSDGKSPRVFPNKKVLFRSDDGAPLGLVGDGYQVVQPVEVVEFFRSLAEDHGFELETAGVLFGGKKYWALARTPEQFSIGKRDQVKAHLMLATSCDGSMSTIAKYVATRVVCNNTIQIALGEGGSQIKVRHNAEFKAESVKEELGLMRESFNAFKETARALGKAKVSSAQAVEYLVRLMGDPSKGIEEQPNIENMKKIVMKFETQNYIGHELSGDSAWGLVNCVTEWHDWDRGRGQDRRLEFSWFGAGAVMKTKAFEVASEMFAS